MKLQKVETGRERFRIDSTREGLRLAVAMGFRLSGVKMALIALTENQWPREIEMAAADATVLATRMALAPEVDLQLPVARPLQSTQETATPTELELV